MQFEKWPYYTYFVKGLGRPYISQSPKWKKQKQKPRLISLCSWLYFEGNVVILFFSRMWAICPGQTDCSGSGVAVRCGSREEARGPRCRISRVLPLALPAVSLALSCLSSLVLSLSQPCAHTLFLSLLLISWILMFELKKKKNWVSQSKSSTWILFRISWKSLPKSIKGVSKKHFSFWNF